MGTDRNLNLNINYCSKKRNYLPQAENSSCLWGSTVALQNMNMLMVPYMYNMCIQNGWRCLISTDNWRTFATCFTIETIPFPSISILSQYRIQFLVYAENLHLELAVGKHKAEDPFRDLNATTDAKLLHVLGVVSVFALLLSLSISQSPSCSNRLVPVSPMSFLP